MRLAYKVWSGVAAGVFCLVAVTDVATDPSATTSPAASSAALAPVAAPAGVATGAVAPAVPAAATAAGTAAGTAAAVVEVIDGDTFRVADGTTVRVLGIDSCEAGTPGGRRATSAARTMLAGSTVTLVAEPGVDRDRYGRALRYVESDGRDLAEAMVVADHTAVYAGRNDASAQRQATLRRLDRDARVCGTAAPAPTTRATPTREPDVDRPAARRPVAPAPAPVRVPSSSGGSASYKNCAAAKAAGAAPLYAGDAGYSGKLDRDGDGVACER